MRLIVNSDSLVSVADAIRTKGNTTEDLQFPQGFVDGINAIESGGKEEQEKSITIVENGTTEVVPDEGKALSKVTVNVEVEQSGGNTDEIETIIDNSGVLDSTEGTVEDKVEQLIEKAQSGTGIILSDFTGSYMQPKKADMRSLVVTESAQQYCLALFANMFVNNSTNGNGGYYVLLEEVYLPDNMAAFSSSMFSYCSNLTTIHGDFSLVRNIGNYAFRSCKKLPNIPYCPNLRSIDNGACENCTGLTEVTLPATITSIHTNAFKGCTNIETVTISEGWNVSLYFHYSEKLTQESLHAMIENLADMNDATTTMWFQVGSTNIGKIDEEHIAMLENKNWNYQ